jgi:hypothetical protein
VDEDLSHLAVGERLVHTLRTDQQSVTVCQNTADDLGLETIVSVQPREVACKRAKAIRAEQVHRHSRSLRHKKPPGAGADEREAHPGAHSRSGLPRPDVGRRQALGQGLVHVARIRWTLAPQRVTKVLQDLSRASLVPGHFG